MMRTEKKESLERKGWRAGTAQEFLGLSPEATASVEARLRFADNLKRRARRRRSKRRNRALNG